MRAPPDADARNRLGGGPDDFFGVVGQGSLFDGDGPGGFNDFQKMEEAGVGVLRQSETWAQIEPSPNHFKWNRTDDVIGNAAAHGSPVLPFIFGSPSWVRNNPAKPPLKTAAQREAWKGFVREFLNRYGQGRGEYWTDEYKDDHPGHPAKPVRALQVWNEPSSGDYWKPKPNPSEYAALVKLTQDAVQTAAPETKIVLAGLFSTPSGRKGGIQTWKFVPKLYKTKGFKDAYDYLALHPYAPSIKFLKKQIRLVHKALKKAHDRSRQIWITELGWASQGPKHTDLVKTPKQQASLLTKSFKLLERKAGAWNIRGVDWFAWQDSDSHEVCGFCRFSGLLKTNRSAKPAFAAYKNATH